MFCKVAASSPGALLPCFLDHYLTFDLSKALVTTPSGCKAFPLLVKFVIKIAGRGGLEDEADKNNGV